MAVLTCLGKKEREMSWDQDHIFVAIYFNPADYKMKEIHIWTHM